MDHSPKNWIQMVFAVLCLAAVGCASSSKKSLTNEEKAVLLVQAAMGSIQENDPTGALQTLREAEELSPKDSAIYLARALALMQKRDFDAALVAAKRATELGPDRSENHTTLGRIYMEKGMFAQAENPLLKAAHNHLYRDAYKAKTSLGLIYYKQGRYSESRQWLDDAIADDQINSCIAYYYRGHLNLRENKVMAATKDYENATKKICAGFAEAHLAVATAYEKSGQIDKAKKKLLSIRDTFPNNPVSDTAIERLKHLK